MTCGIKNYYAARFSEMWGPARWAVFSPAGVRVREFVDDSRESGLAANKLARLLSAQVAAAKREAEAAKLEASK